MGVYMWIPALVTGGGPAAVHMTLRLSEETEATGHGLGPEQHSQEAACPCYPPSACWGPRSGPGGSCGLRAPGPQELSQEARACSRAASWSITGREPVLSLTFCSTVKLTAASHARGSWVVPEALCWTSQGIPARGHCKGPRKTHHHSALRPRPGGRLALPVGTGL